MRAFQTVRDESERLFDGIGEAQIIHLFLRDGAKLSERLPIHDGLPVTLAEQDDWELSVHLARLLEGHELKQLVHCPEAARRRDEGLHVVRHPEFACEEVCKGMAHGQLDRFSERMLRVLIDDLCGWAWARRPH